VKKRLVEEQQDKERKQEGRERRQEGREKRQEKEKHMAAVESSFVRGNFVRFAHTLGVVRLVFASVLLLPSFFAAAAGSRRRYRLFFFSFLLLGFIFRKKEKDLN